MENYEDVLKEIEKEQNAAAQKYFADLLEKMESGVSADLNGKKKVQIDVYEDENGKQRLAVKDFDGNVLLTTENEEDKNRNITLSLKKNAQTMSSEAILHLGNQDDLK